MPPRPEDVGGHRARHPERLGHGDAERRERLHAGGERARAAHGAGAEHVVRGDLRLPETERGGAPADRRHRVRDQEERARRLGAERDPQRRLGHVPAVGDQRAGDAVVGQRGADQARFTGAEPAHGVEEVGDEAQPVPDRAVQRGGVRGAVPRGQVHARRGQAREQRGRDHLRGEGHERGHTEAGEQAGVIPGEGPEPLGRMGAGVERVEERPLDVEPEHARHAGVARRADGRGGGGDRRVGRADQRRQERRGAEGAVGGGDRRDPFRGRLVLEQDVAAAVDLEVDQAGRRERAVQLDALGAPRDLRVGDDVHDPLARHEDRMPGQDRVPRARDPSDQGQHGHAPAGSAPAMVKCTAGA